MPGKEERVMGFIFEFGKHRGKELREVPVGYVVWAHTKTIFLDNLAKDDMAYVKDLVERYPSIEQKENFDLVKRFRRSKKTIDEGCPMSVAGIVEDKKLNSPWPTKLIIVTDEGRMVSINQIEGVDILIGDKVSFVGTVYGYGSFFSTERLSKMPSMVADLAKEIVIAKLNRMRKLSVNSVEVKIDRSRTSRHRRW